jgi:hypothetical protein
MGVASVVEKVLWVGRRAGRVLVEPTLVYAQEVTNEPGWGYRGYYVPLVLVMLGITTLLSWYGIGVYGLCGVCGRVPVWEQALIMLVLEPVSVCLGATVLHLGVICAGGHAGLGQTAKTLFYAKTPYLVFGWIPILGSVVPLYSLGLTLIGIRAVHGISWPRTVIAILIGAASGFVLIFCTVLLAILVSFWAAFVLLAIAATFIGIILVSR